MAICGSGVGAAVCANKVPGVRACLIQDHFSARQGVEDDHMNVLCMGGRVVGLEVAWDLVETFLAATFSRAERHLRRLGKVAARVVAPPRLFVVDTPVAAAVDLGCAYELAVEPDGRTRLRVTSGVVSLEGHGRVAYTPMDTEVLAAPGRGPGTPVAIDAPEELRAAVARFDGGDAAAVRAIVELAEALDTVTLWNLLSRTAAADRAAVLARLDALSPRPPDVRAEDVLAGDAGAIERWRDALALGWSCAGCGRSPGSKSKHEK